MQDVMNMNYKQLKTYFRLDNDEHMIHSSKIVKTVCEVNGGTIIVDMCPTCFKEMHHKKQKNAFKVHPDGYFENLTLDCKNVFYEIDEDGKIHSTGQCCCYCSEHGVREE